MVDVRVRFGQVHHGNNQQSLQQPNKKKKTEERGGGEDFPPQDERRLLLLKCQSHSSTYDTLGRKRVLMRRCCDTTLPREAFTDAHWHIHEDNRRRACEGPWCQPVPRPPVPPMEGSGTILFLRTLVLFHSASSSSTPRCLAGDGLLLM